MRSIKRAKKLTKLIQQDTLKDKVFATIDGVLQPIVYDSTQIDGSVNKQNVFLTPQERILKRNNASNTKSVSTVQELVVTDGVETAVQTTPLFVFDYQRGFADVTSGGNIKTWLSSVGSNKLTQSDANKRPDVGANGGGINRVVPANFVQPNFDFLSLSSTVTLSGDFTMFFFIIAIPFPLPKKVRLLGKSDDNDMYFSIGESINKSYKISFASGSTAEAAISTPYWESHSTKILITVQRKSDALIIRENGTQVFTGTTPISDFVFDQFGKLGNDGFETFNGNVYHFSAYNTLISTNLEDLENSIITQSLLATE